ncbi:MAG: GNAT family N-acetyltransferase [Coprobacillus sp.]
MEVFVKPYKDINQKEKDDIIIMLSQIWTEFTGESEIHHNDLTVQSFYIYHHKKVIAYAGVVLQTIRYCNRDLKVASLSCVAVSSTHQGKGIGKQLVNIATDWIEAQNIDIGIFTCQPSLTKFYTHDLRWQVANQVILKASHHKQAISSDGANVDAIICCLTDDLIIEKTVFYLNLPNGQFV